MEKIERITEILNINSLKVKRILGLPIKDCYALSAEKAKEIFENTEDEEEKYSALVKWMTLTSDWDEASYAYRNVVSSSEEEILTLRRMIELGANFDQIFETFENIDDAMESLEGSMLAAYVVLYQQALTAALSACQNTDQIRQIWNRENLSDENQELIFPTWLSLCQTTDDFEDMLSDFSDEDDENEKVKAELIRQQWNKLFNEKLNRAYDFDTCAAVYDVCPNKPEDKEKVIIKWLQSCRTSEQVENIYEKIDSEEYSDTVEVEMVKKLYQLL